MALEKILTDGSETGQTSADKINASFDLIDSTIGTLTRTVAADGEASPDTSDFATFDDAMQWVLGLPASACVELVLAEGIHYVAEAVTNYGRLYDVRIRELYIKGDGESAETRETTFITTPNTANTNSAFYFAFADYSYQAFRLSGVTIDPAHGGKDMTSITVYPYLLALSALFVSNCDIKNAYDGGYFGGAMNAEYYQVRFSDLNRGIYMSRTDINVVLNECSFTNVPQVIRASPDFGVNIKIATSLELVNASLGVETNTMINYGGSVQYLTDNGWTGNTANRPDMTYNTLGSNISYFNTDLGEPEWWNGTEWVQGLEAITEETIKTVGVGKDFETFDEAMQWVMSVSTIGKGFIDIQLDDGVHEIGNILELDEWNWSKYTITNEMRIGSASGIKENCTITVPNIDDGDSGFALFCVNNGVYFALSKVTVDTTLNGYPYTDGPIIISCFNGSANVLESTLKNFYFALDIRDRVSVYNSEIIGNGGVYAEAVTLLNSGVGSITNTSISDCDNGVYVKGATARLDSVTFTNNDTDTNVPLNEIQYDGGYISDGTSPLQTKDLEVITDTVIKTVGAGKDFETLHLALRWAEKTTLAYSDIIFMLDDGIHVLGGEGEADDSLSWTYYSFTNKRISITSDANSSTNCFITLDGWDDGQNWYALFEVVNSYLRINRVTLDIALDGYPYPQTIELGYIINSTFFSSYGVFKNLSGIAVSGGSNINFTRVTLDNLEYGVSAQKGGVAYIYEPIVSNCPLGLNANSGGTINLTAPTFTNNTEDTNIPLNEIQYNGSYISDGTVPLQQKGLEVITEIITKTVGAGKDFETLHLALRWVESVTQTKGYITLSLDDGIHILGGEGEFNETDWSYYQIDNKALQIISASRVKENCTLTLDGFDDDENWPDVITTNFSSLLLQEITIDLTLDGYPYPQTAYPINIYSQSRLTSQDLDYRNSVGFYLSKAGVINFVQTSFDNCGEAAITAYSSQIIFASWEPGIIISNATNGISLNEGATATGAGAITYTNVTNETNMPLNEIQFDGSYISDGTSPLQQKGLEVISESVTKTVGVGKDFETLHLALRWVETVSQTSGSITITLDDGTHILGGEGEFDDLLWVYYFLKNKKIRIDSASGNKADCNITLSGWDDGEQYPVIISTESTEVAFFNLTFDLTLDGYLYPSGVTALSFNNFSTLRTTNVDFLNSGRIVINNSWLRFDASTIDNITTCLSVMENSYGLIKDSSLINSTMVLMVGYSSKVELDTVDFTGSTPSTSIPLNEIQYDGSYISDGTGPLNFKS